MLNWYVAHAMMVMKFQDGNQDLYRVMENVILVSAESDKEAAEKAVQRAKEDEVDIDDDYTYDSRPITWEFVGLRKLITCVFPEERPTNGTELTYSEFEISDKEEFEKYINGDTVTVVYYDA
ncbi:DUF4288 domain-containing protein [Anaerolineales bacterium HSG25]|nr:DUF4288 domain-containing protein [Anaerolineales bacterium HSG25]